MSDGVTVFDLVGTAIGLWAVYFTVFDPVLWGMASGVASPFDVLAQAVLVLVVIAGVIEAVVLTALLLGGLLALALKVVR